jgi:phosphoglycerate kinase
VNDAFGTAHRAHASTTIIANFSKRKCFGTLLAKEIESLNKVLKNSENRLRLFLEGLSKNHSYREYP